jgi:DNA-binding phage protein
MGNSTKEELQPIDGLEVIGDMTFAEKFQKYLDAKGKRPADVARDAAVSPSQISKYRSGETKPSVQVVLRISRATGIPLEYWLDEDMTELPERDELTPDEARLLWAVKALGLDAEEVLRRIGGVQSEPSSRLPSPQEKPLVTQASKQGPRPKRDVR